MPTSFLLAFTASVLSGLLLASKALDWGFVDQPEARKVHQVPTPRTGGLAMWLGCLAALLALRLLGRGAAQGIPLATWGAGLGFVGLGAMDDRFAYHPRFKFWIMLGLSGLAAWPWAAQAGAVHIGTALFKVPPAAAFGLLTLWFMAVPNAVNIEDAINGYMGGFTFIVLGAACLLGVDTSLLLGALAGFLLLNWPRARHFMGDAGSFGCGFLVAESLLRAGGLARPALAVILTAPISMDVLMGMVRRKRLGQSLFHADRGTCPHRVLSLVGSPAWASPLLWLNALAFVWDRDKPVLLALHLALYAGTLVFLNRGPLFRSREAEA